MSNAEDTTAVADVPETPVTAAECVRGQLQEENPEALFCDGADEAVAGIARRCGQPALVVYDVVLYLAMLERDGMSSEEAQEFFDFNVVGAWVGPHTPLFLYPCEPGL